jgi:hypothetical protein
VRAKMLGAFTEGLAMTSVSLRMGSTQFGALWSFSQIAQYARHPFSKKAENHAHMMAIYFMHYNFVRIHQTLRVTPAMAAKVTGRLWEMADMVKVLEDWETSETG